MRFLILLLTLLCSCTIAELTYPDCPEFTIGEHGDRVEITIHSTDTLVYFSRTLEDGSWRGFWVHHDYYDCISVPNHGAVMQFELNGCIEQL